MVEPDGNKEVYDVYYANDTASVFDQLRDAVKDRPSNAPVERGDRPVTERVAGRDIADRNAVEAAYRDGDAATRKALLAKALETPDTAPIDLLRLALFGLDVEASRSAQQALARTDTPAAAELISEALRVPMDASTRESLIAALERIGVKSRRAEWLAAVHRGLASKSTPIDPEAWSKALAAAGSTAPVNYERNALQRDRSSRAAQAKSRPDDPMARLELAVVTLDLALRGVRENPANAKEEDAFRKLLLHDARTAASEAESLGVEDWRTSAVLTLATYYDGRALESYARAEQAVKEMPEGEPSWNASAVLTIFAESRFKAIQQSIRDKRKWSPEWLADLHATYSVLLRHPLGTVEQVIWYYDFLDWLRARHRAAQYLEAGLARFEGSSELHKRYRELLVAQRGVGALEDAYATRLQREDHHRDLAWFAGYASLVAAETYRRGGDLAQSQAAYGRALSGFERAIVENPATRTSSDGQAALALAGRARVAYMLGDDDASLADVLASFARAPDVAGTRDGAGVTPGETGQMLLARLVEGKRDAPVAQLKSALDALDQELLRPDRP
jgi:hypothetical protein